MWNICLYACHLCIFFGEVCLKNLDLFSFLIGLFSYWVINMPWIFWIVVPYRIYILQCFSPFYVFCSHSLTLSFIGKFLILMKSIGHALGVIFKKSLAYWDEVIWVFSLIISSRSFIALCFILTSMIHYEFIFVLIF